MVALPQINVTRDRMNQASVKDVALGITSIASAVQVLPKHIRVLSAAGFLRLLTERLGVEPQDVMTAIANLQTSPEAGARVEWRAIESYLQEDLLT